MKSYYSQMFIKNGTLRGTPYYGKCPDLIVDGVWYEHEAFTKPNPKSNFSNMLRRGLSQSDRIIINKKWGTLPDSPQLCIMNYAF